MTFKLTGGGTSRSWPLPFASADPRRHRPSPAEMRPVPGHGPYRISIPEEAEVLRLVRNPGFREWSADAQPRGFPDAITISWPYDLADPSSRVRGVKRGHADVTTLGGPPLPKEEVVPARSRYPAQLHFEYGLRHGVLLPRHPQSAVQRGESPWRGSTTPSTRSTFPTWGGTAACDTCSPTSPRYEPGCLYASRGIHGIRPRPKASQARRRGRRPPPLVVGPGPPARGVHGVAPQVKSDSAQRQSDKIRGGCLARSTTSPLSLILGTGAGSGFGGWGADFPSAASLPATPELRRVYANLTRNEYELLCDPSINTKMGPSNGITARRTPPAAETLSGSRSTRGGDQAPLVPTDNQRNSYFVCQTRRQLPVQPAIRSPSLISVR